MKILFVGQHFYPELFRGNDVAFHMAELGHDVHVVVGTPNYPAGKFYDGYGWFRRSHEVVNGVKITRVPVIPRGRNSGVQIFLNYMSFWIVACVYMLFHAIGHKYDMVFAQQSSPITMSAHGILYKKLRRVPLYTWVLDVWPDCLRVAGNIQNKYVLGFFDWFVKQQYKVSDKLLISSRSFESSILKYGDYKDKIVYFPQWGDGEQKKSTEVKLENEAWTRGFKIVFTGNLGEAQGMECNLKAALLTKEHKEIKWVFVGAGRRLQWMENFVAENNLSETVFLLGYHPVGEMPYYFAQADLLLASLADSPLFNLYSPAKISSYMESGKPILCVMNGEGERLVKESDCGWTVSANDAESLAKLAIELSGTDKAILVEKGIKGRRFYEANFDKVRCLHNLDKLLGL